MFIPPIPIIAKLLLYTHFHIPSLLHFTIISLQLHLTRLHVTSYLPGEYQSHQPVSFNLHLTSTIFCYLIPHYCWLALRAKFPVMCQRGKCETMRKARYCDIMNVEVPRARAKILSEYMWVNHTDNNKYVLYMKRPMLQGKLESFYIPIAIMLQLWDPAC